MNITQNLLSVLIISIALLGCKKKTDPAPVAPVTPVAPVIKSPMTAKVDGQTWATYADQYVSGTAIFTFSNTYSFSGQSKLSSPYSSIKVSFTYTSGVVSLTSNGLFKASYKDENNVYYTSKTGTLNITSIDTVNSNGSIFTKLAGNFSFNTDTIAGVSHQITNGVIDYNKN